jgi:hypothetical protein
MLQAMTQSVSWFDMKKIHFEHFWEVVRKEHLYRELVLMKDTAYELIHLMIFVTILQVCI